MIMPFIYGSPARSRIIMIFLVLSWSRHNKSYFLTAALSGHTELNITYRVHIHLTVLVHIGQSEDLTTL